jgi:hypothetical protein
MNVPRIEAVGKILPVLRSSIRIAFAQEGGVVYTSVIDKDTFWDVIDHTKRG